MTSLAPNYLLPASVVFHDDAAMLRPALPPFYENEEVQLHFLARTIVEFFPEEAHALYEMGMERLRAGLAEA